MAHGSTTSRHAKWHTSRRRSRLTLLRRYLGAPVLLIPLLIANVAGCRGPKSPSRERPPATQAAGDREPSKVFDVRRIAAQLSRYQGSEQVCNLVHVGQLAEAPARVSRNYPIPISRRRLVRCEGPSGGWADLVFRKEARSLAPFITTGQQLRVKVIAGSGGFEDYPVLEFVATMGETEPRPAPLEEPDIGEDFGTSSGELESHRTRTCAVAFVGRFEKIHHRRKAYPKHARYRMSVACRHVGGIGWIDAVFSRNEVDEALSLRRAERRAWTIYRSGGGLGDHPIVVPAGPTKR